MKLGSSASTLYHFNPSPLPRLRHQRQGAEVHERTADFRGLERDGDFAGGELHGAELLRGEGLPAARVRNGAAQGLVAEVQGELVVREGAAQGEDHVILAGLGQGHAPLQPRPVVAPGTEEVLGAIIDRRAALAPGQT